MLIDVIAAVLAVILVVFEVISTLFTEVKTLTASTLVLTAAISTLFTEVSILTASTLALTAATSALEAIVVPAIKILVAANKLLTETLPENSAATPDTLVVKLPVLAIKLVTDKLGLTISVALVSITLTTAPF